MKISTIIRCGSVALSETFDGAGYGEFNLYANDDYHYSVEYNTFRQRAETLADMLHAAAGMIESENLTEYRRG